MAESIAFDLKLIDSVSGTAKRAANALRTVENSAKKAQQALNFGSDNKRAEFNLKKLGADPGGYVKLVKAQKELKEQRNKLLEDAGIKKPESFFAGITSRFSFAKIASAAAVGELMAEGAMKVGESLLEAARGVVETISDGVKDAFSAAGKEQTLRIGERNTLGVEGARGFREDAEKFAKLTPFNDSEIRQMMLPMRRAGLSQAASRQAFATATDIGGGDKDAVGGVLEQFKRIYTKQGIGKRQLVELLGNVGTTIPDFYKELGKRMHISAKAAEKKAESGGLDPQLLMNMITEAQNKKQGGIAGTGGQRFADSFEVRWKKIKDLPDEFYKKFVDSPSFARANEALGQFLEQLSPDSPAGQRIMASLDRMFDRIGGLLSNPEELVDGLVDGIENAIGLFEQLLPDIKDMGYALAAAADEMAKLVTGARVFFAIQHGDVAEAARITKEATQAKIERMAGRMKEQNERNERRSQGQVAFMGALPGNPFGVYQPPSGKTGGKVVHMQNHVTQHFHGVPDEETAKKAGDETTRHTVRALDRASSHWGN